MNDWPVRTPAEEGMDETLFAAAVSEYRERTSDVHDVVVIRNGALVFEASRYPYPEGTPHALMSCTKSVLSLLVGIAVDEGRIPGVHTHLSRWFPELEGDPERKDMELFHLLSMTTGLSWRETGGYGAGDSYLEMLAQNDPVSWFFSRPMAHEPGSTFSYNSGASMIAGIALEKAVGMDLLEYASPRLFEPLGIDVYVWQTAAGHRNGASGIYITARDMAKLGQFALNGGTWQGRRIVSARWLRHTTRKLFDTPRGVAGNDGYGMGWWMNARGGFSARGFGGQYILVYPKEKLVIVATGGLFRGDFLYPEAVLAERILDSIGKPRPDPEAMRACLAAFGPPPGIGGEGVAVPASGGQGDGGASSASQAAASPDQLHAPAFLGKRYRFEDGTVFSLSETGDGRTRLLSLFVNGNDVSARVPVDGGYAAADLGSFGTLPRNLAMIAIPRITTDSVELLVRRLGVPYTYTYEIRFTAAAAGRSSDRGSGIGGEPDAVWSAYASYLRGPFEEFRGWLLE